MKEQKEQEYFETMNGHLYEQLTFAETKNIVLSGLIGTAIFGLISFLSTSILDDFSFYYFSCLFGSLFVGLLITLFSFIPNFKKLNGDSKPNIYFWGDIARLKNYSDYKEKTKISSEEYETLIAEQNIHIARIIKKKNTLFSWAIRIVIAGIIPIYFIWILVILFKKLFKK